MNLVLLPGFMTDAALWDAMIDRLRALGPITFGDLFQDTTIEAMAARVLAGAPERFALIGFSMGGYVAREIARLAPERVVALVLIATSARADTPARARRKAAAVENVKTAGFAGLSHRAIAASLHPDRAGDEVLIARVRAMGDRLGGDVFIRQAEHGRDSDLDRLGAIDPPTLVVAAAADGLRGLDEARELEAGIPGASLVVVEGSGHMLPLEAPDALCEIVIPWLVAHAGAADI